jgi:hypothetical protein
MGLGREEFCRGDYRVGSAATESEFIAGTDKYFMANLDFGVYPLGRPTIRRATS